jgi:small subunit ribosomal protein S3
MIEREFVNQKTKEFFIKKYIENKLKGAGISQIRLKKIPLGEKIIVHTSRPSLIVGSKGSNIKDLTRILKQKFKLENPQVEIVEVKEVNLDASIVAQRIAGSLERFGSARFKGVGHKTMTNILAAGALGVELIISGKIPGARARSWRFYQGYLKKCGDVAVSGVRSAQASARLKSGIIGIKVAIMPPGIVLPDSVEILSEPIQVEEEITVKVEEKKVKKPAKKKVAKKTTKKKVTKKKVAKKKEESKKETKAEETKDVKKAKVESKEEVKVEVKEETKAETKKETEKSE